MNRWSLSFLLTFLWISHASAGCCSQKHKTCDATYCGKSQSQCAACSDKKMLWLPDGANSDPNPKCIPRWKEKNGQCESNSDCCGALVCDHKNNPWWTVCQHPVDVCAAYSNKKSCKAARTDSKGRQLEQNCNWNNNKCVPKDDYRVLAGGSSPPETSTTTTTTTTTTQPPPVIDNGYGSVSGTSVSGESETRSNGVCELPSYLKKFSVITKDNLNVKAKNTYTGLLAGGNINIGVQNQIDVWTAGSSRGVPQNERLVLYKTKSGGRLQCNQCSIQQNSNPLQKAGVDWDDLVWLAENLVDSTDGQFKVKVFTKGGKYTQHMIRDKDWQDEDNGKTLVVFNTEEDITLERANDGDKFGPSVLAPKAKVTLAAGNDYVDGWVVAKSFVSASNAQQLHGDEYDGPIECRAPTTTTTTTTTTQPPPTTTTTTTQPPPETTPPSPSPPSDCDYELLETNPGDPDLEDNTLTFVQKGDGTVDFTVTQTWKDGTMSHIQTAYKNPGEDTYTCTDPQKKSNFAPGATYQQTAECDTDGYAYVVLVPKDGQFTGTVSNDWGCPGWGNGGKQRYLYKIKIPCSCSDLPPPETTAPPPPPPPICTKDFPSQGSDHCPDHGGVTILVVEGTEPTSEDKDIVYGITETDGSSIKFKIRNPFDSEMQVYVQYKEQEGPVSQLQCIGEDLSDCEDESATEIEATCFAGHESSVSLLHIYFVDPTAQNENIFGPVEVDKCCHADDPPPTSVARYSIMVRCQCPTLSEGRQLRGTLPVAQL